MKANARFSPPCSGRPSLMMKSQTPLTGWDEAYPNGSPAQQNEVAAAQLLDAGPDETSGPVTQIVRLPRCSFRDPPVAEQRLGRRAVRMTELVQRGPVPVHRLEISLRRWHANVIGRHQGIFRAIVETNETQLRQCVELVRGMSQSLEGVDGLVGNPARAVHWLAERFPANFAIEEPDPSASAHASHTIGFVATKDVRTREEISASADLSSSVARRTYSSFLATMPGLVLI